MAAADEPEMSASERLFVSLVKSAPDYAVIFKPDASVVIPSDVDGEFVELIRAASGGVLRTIEICTIANPYFLMRHSDRVREDQATRARPSRRRGTMADGVMVYDTP